MRIGLLGKLAVTTVTPADVLTRPLPSRQISTDAESLRVRGAARVITASAELIELRRPHQ
jgi:hypothetical protein